MTSTKEWREAILAERKHGTVHEAMKRALSYMSGPKATALVLGDASLVQSKYLLDVEHFTRVVDVDFHPALFDDGPVSTGDQRIERILEPFDAYTPPIDIFDFIYGKSIAFNPKETILPLLKNLNRSLKSTGIFCAVWAAEGDSFRSVHYTENELRELYSQSDFKIVYIHSPLPTQNKGLTEPGIRHVMTIISKKRS